MARLRLLGDDKVRQFPLSNAETIVGRDPTCDIVIDAVKVSRRHARIFEKKGAYFVEDLGSANGTFANDIPVQGSAPLRYCDSLRLGNLTFIFEDEKERTAPTETLVEAPAAPVGDDQASMVSLDGTRLRLETDPQAKLRALVEIAANLSSTLDLAEVLPTILQSLFTIFPKADRGFVLLKDQSTGQMSVKAARDRKNRDGLVHSLSKTILEHVLSTRQAVLTDDATLDARFGEAQSVREHVIRSMMCAPLLGRDGVPIGVIQLDSADRRRAFLREDLDVLICTATQAAQAIELAVLHQQRQELEAARQIQLGFLPQTRPIASGWTFFDHYQSARQVGGDYFDYVELGSDRMIVAVGDVAGKGAPAALHMARLSAAARFCFDGAVNLGEAAGKLEATLARANRDRRFVTFLAAMIELRTGRISLVNAGHITPILKRYGSSVPERVGDEVAGLPLGFASGGAPRDTAVVELNAGDALLFCSDGIVEARNASGEMYGLDRLIGCFGAVEGDAAALGSGVRDDLSRFVAGRRADDDTTLVCFRRDL